MRIPHPTKNWGPPLPPALCYNWADKGFYLNDSVDHFGNLKSCPKGSKASDMTSEGLGELFEGDSADTCAGKFPLKGIGCCVIPKGKYELIGISWGKLSNGRENL